MSKICCMIFSKKYNCNLYLPPKINDVYIKEVYNTKFLGLFIDHQLKWAIVMVSIIIYHATMKQEVLYITYMFLDVILRSSQRV